MLDILLTASAAIVRPLGICTRWACHMCAKRLELPLSVVASSSRQAASLVDDDVQSEGQAAGQAMTAVEGLAARVESQWQSLTWLSR